MSTGSGPPEQPPMMSPDGKWVWNGQQWLPVAVHESVFPAYTEAAAAAASDPVPMAVASPPFPPVGPAAMAPTPAVASPVIVQPLNYSAQGATPPWMPQGGGARTSYMYAGAAFVVVILGVIMTIAFTQSWLPFLNAGNNNAGSSPAPAATPTPQLAVRSQFAIAARYVDSVVTPGIQTLNPSFTAYAEACNGTLSRSCNDAVTAADTELRKLIATLAAAPPPTCISRQVAKLQSDLNTTEAGIQGELKAFKDNNRNELLQAMNQQRAGSKPLGVDLQVLAKAQAACDGQQEGP